MTVTIVSILLIVWLASVTKISQWVNSSRINERCFKCILMGLKISKVIGMIVFGLIGVVSLIALCALIENEEYYHFAIIEIAHIFSLAVVASTYGCIYP